MVVNGNNAHTIIILEENFLEKVMFMIKKKMFFINYNPMLPGH
jgi:hypothetical protein